MKEKKIRLRSSVSRGLKDANPVDRENHVIRGYSVISVGELKGHGIDADQKTVDQVVEFGQSHKHGIKSRFGHPNMSSTAFGTYLGRSKNFRVDGEHARADLHISDTAFETPQGDLGTYVENMAEKEPDMFGASVVVRADTVARVDEEGEPETDEEGNELNPVLRVRELAASDIVDSPATGDDMFEFFSDGVKPSAEVTAFMDEFLKQPDAMEKAVSFINRYVENAEYKQTLLNSIEKVVDMKDDKKENKEKKEELKITLEEGDTGMKEKVEKKEIPVEDKISAARKEEVEELARKQERERVQEINVTCEEFGLKKEFAAKLINDETKLSDARKLMIDEAAKKLKSTGEIEVNNDNIAMQRNSMVNSILLNTGMLVNEDIRKEVAKTQFSGLTLQNLAKYCLTADGHNVMFMSGGQVFDKLVEHRYFAQAPTQGSGDFVNVLSNVLNKSAQKGWQTAPSTFERWVGNGSLRDFKQADLPRLSEMGDVKEIQEGEAPEMANMSDLKELARLKTWGTKYILSRQAMVNDDMAMLTTIPQKQARALRRHMNKRCYNLLYDDNGSGGAAFLGPTMNQDGVRCFNAANHNNFVAAGSGAVPSQSTLDTAFVNMANQTASSPDNSDSESIYLDIIPNYILIGPNYNLETFKLMNNIGYNVSGEDSAAEGTAAANIHGPGSPRNLTIVSDAELDNIDDSYYPWYLAANPMDVDTVTLWTLNGQTSPFTDTAPTPTGDARGMIWVIEHDFVFTVVDYRGLYCNSGEAK